MKRQIVLRPEEIPSLGRQDLLLWESTLRNSQTYEAEELHELVMARLRSMAQVYIVSEKSPTIFERLVERVRALL